MKTYSTLESIGEDTGESKVYLMLGHGTRNQFRSLADLKKALRKVSKHIKKDAVVFYFGDYPDKKNPDIGYAFKLLSEMRPDIRFVMIQIREAESWGVPDFAKGVYWHGDFPKEGDCKWGGFDSDGKPCSNTAKWATFHRRIHPVETVFVLGGGPITVNEVKYAKKLKIPVVYYPVERRYKGDKETRITDEDSLQTRFGPLGPTRFTHRGARRKTIRGRRRSHRRGRHSRRQRTIRN